MPPMLTHANTKAISLTFNKVCVSGMVRTSLLMLSPDISSYDSRMVGNGKSPSRLVPICNFSSLDSIGVSLHGPG